MLRKEKAVRRLLVVIMIMAMIMVLAAAPALATSVSANCGTSGYFYTRATADNWQDHWHDGNLWHTWYYGTQYKAHGWGSESGLQYGDIYGPNLTSPSAICPN